MSWDSKLSTQNNESVEIYVCEEYLKSFSSSGYKTFSTNFD